MKININQVCTVILQERGVKALEKYYTNLELPLPKKYEVGTEYTGPLWIIMRIFGPMSYMGPQPPFKCEFEINTL